MAGVFPQLRAGPPVALDDSDEDLNAQVVDAAPLVDWKCRKQVYVGTWSHTDRHDLKAPRDMGKGDFGLLLVRLLGEIFRKQSEDSGQRSRLNRVDKVSVFQELHSNGEIHYHFILLSLLTILGIFKFWLRGCGLIKYASSLQHHIPITGLASYILPFQVLIPMVRAAQTWMLILGFLLDIQTGRPP